MTETNPQIEEAVARALLLYFTESNRGGLVLDDQPQSVKDLWLGAARVAIKATGEER